MSIEHQAKILKKFLIVTYFVTQIFGFWPYYVDPTNRHIKYNRLKFVYSILLPLIITYSHYSYAIAILASLTDAKIHSETLRIVTVFHSMFITFCFFVLYIRQLLTFRNAKSLYFKYTRVSKSQRGK